MSVAVVSGYVAAALVFVTFYMKTMIPLCVIRSCSRSLLRWTLPVAVRGRSWAISNRRGRL